jgi:hypothetical protein
MWPQTINRRLGVPRSEVQMAEPSEFHGAAEQDAVVVVGGDVVPGVVAAPRVLTEPPLWLSVPLWQLVQLNSAATPPSAVAPVRDAGERLG